MTVQLTGVLINNVNNYIYSHFKFSCIHTANLFAIDINLHIKCHYNAIFNHVTHIMKKMKTILILYCTTHKCIINNNNTMADMIN